MTVASGTAAQVLSSHAAHTVAPSMQTATAWIAPSNAGRRSTPSRTAPSSRAMTSPTPIAEKALDAAAAVVAAAHRSSGGVAGPVSAPKTTTATPASAAARVRLKRSFSGRRYCLRSRPKPTSSPAVRQSTTRARRQRHEREEGRRLADVDRPRLPAQLDVDDERLGGGEEGHEGGGRDSVPRGGSAPVREEEGPDRDPHPDGAEHGHDEHAETPRALGPLLRDRPRGNRVAVAGLACHEGFLALNARFLSRPGADAPNG